MNINQYYNFIVDKKHSTGDIWKNLPTFGLLKEPFLSGIVITPQCDLSNRKVETITYLPIVSLKSYFCSIAYIRKLIDHIFRILKKNKIEISDYLLKSPSLTATEIDLLIGEVSKKFKTNSNSEKVIVSLKVLKAIIDPKVLKSSMKTIKTIYAADEWVKLLEEIVRNVQSHMEFLPSDKREINVSGVTEGSLVLFRYPISVPIGALDKAMETDEQNWPEVVDELSISQDIYKFFKYSYPIKTQTLKSEYLHDMINRFCMYYLRLGSPDLASGEVDEQIVEITGE